jgi:hypothetical protein
VRQPLCEIFSDYFLALNDKRKARERERVTASSFKGISFLRELDGSRPLPYAASVGLADR